MSGSTEDLVNNETSERVLTIPTVTTLIGTVAILIYTLQFSFSILITTIPLTIFVAVLSDLADGHSTRKLNQETEIGKVIDSLRDRLILIAGVANILMIKEDSIYMAIFFFVVISEIYSF